MDLFASECYKQLNPNKKDAKWFNDVITIFRRDWVQLVNRERAIENRQILFSQQPMDNVKAFFSDKEFLENTDFVPLGIWGRIFNIILEELRSDPPEITVRANDESAMMDKQADIKRLSTFTQHQKAVSELNSRVGLPPLPADDTKFKTNIKEMLLYGLDPNDKEDIDFFHRNDFIRLKQEIAANKVISAVLNVNNYDKEILEDNVIDILSTNTCTVHKYVSQTTGEQKIQRIFPEEVYGIFGNKRDGSRDICNGWVQNVPLRDFIAMAGQDFDFERDWYQLLWALNFSNNSTYTGFTQGNREYNGKHHPNYESDKDYFSQAQGYSGEFGGKFLSWEQAYTYNVQVGYIEFCSIDATKSYLSKKDKNGKEIEVGKIVPYGYDLDDKEVTEGYVVENITNEQFYYSYFLPTTSISQWIYNFGKVIYQDTQGVNDEYSCGNMIVYRKEGASAVDISKTDIFKANQAAYRILWLLSKVQPNKEDYDWDEVMELAQLFKREYQQDNEDSPIFSVGNILEDIVKVQKQSHVRIRVRPRIDGRKTQDYHRIEVQQPRDLQSMWIESIEKTAIENIAQMVGLNDVRLGQVQNARKGFKASEMETTQSEKSTGYIFRIIQYVKERICTRILNTTQDAIAFEDSLACDWIRSIIGELQFNNLKNLKDYADKNKAAHRLGLYVGNYITAMDRQKVIQAADMALANQDGKGGIELNEWGIITREKDPRQGLALLEQYREKARKRTRKEKLEEIKMQQDHQKEMQANEAKMQQAKDAADIQKAQIPAQAMVQVAQLNNKTKEDITDKKIENEPAKQQTRTANQKDLATHKSDLQQQESY